MKYWLSSDFHISWMLAVAGTMILAGIALAQYMQPESFAALSWLFVGGILVGWACMRQQRWVVVLVLIGGLLIGLWRGSAEQIQLRDYGSFYGNVVTMRGIVSDDTATDKRGNTVLRLKEVTIGNKQLPGTAWVILDTASRHVERSDQVTVTGKLQAGFGTFAATIYRAKLERIERPEPGDIALHVRDWFASAVRQAIPEPESSLGVGYLVGQRRDLPEDLNTALKIAGLTHIVVASGYNLTILVRLARRLFDRISKYLATLVSGGLIAGFIAVTGMSPSMSRAGLVAGLSLAAWYYGRKFHPLVLLSIAAGVTVLINPYYAWGDVGWQLSFAAFAGVMIFAPLLQEFYFGKKKPGILRQILGETISATILTAPILLYGFGQISNIAIIANLLILPLVPLAMLLTFIAGIGALVMPFLATVFGYPALVVLSYMTQTTRFFADIPWAVSELKIEGWYVFVMYALLVAFTFFMWRKTNLNLRESNIVE